MLGGSKLNTPENLAVFSQRFDEGVKKVFSDNQAAKYVKFGTPGDNYPRCGIKAGRLTFTQWVNPYSINELASNPSRT